MRAARGESKVSGLRAVLFSIAVAGVVGYAIQLLAPALTDETTYIGFSVFWSTLYLGGTAMSGVQQEISRATHPGYNGSGSATIGTFTLWAAGTVLVAVLLIAIVLGRTLFAEDWLALSAALAVGLIGYLLMAVLSGVLYGVRSYTKVAFIVIADALIRAVLVIAGLLLGAPVAVLAILIAAPFLLAFALTFVAFKRGLARSFELDVGLRTLVAHAASTSVAATASGVMISGLPMLIALTSASSTPPATAALILAITIARAPIVVPIQTLQSYLISGVLRSSSSPSRRILMRALCITVACVIAVSATGWVIGPPIVAFVSAGRFTITGVTASSIVLSACLVAVMCLTGPTLISRRQHIDNAVGWVLSAIGTIVILLLPLGDFRVSAALIIPAVLGIAVHVLALTHSRRRAARAPKPLSPPLKF